MCYPISIRPAYMDEYEKLEEELKKAYEVIIAGSNLFFLITLFCYKRGKTEQHIYGNLSCFRLQS